MKIDFPGIGGSLGECAVCGGSFTKEILLGESIATGCLTGLSSRLPLHKECCDKLEEISKTDKDWRRLPEGPLRKEFEEASN
jgi:hypothetical protein